MAASVVPLVVTQADNTIIVGESARLGEVLGALCQESHPDAPLCHLTVKDYKHDLSDACQSQETELLRFNDGGLRQVSFNVW